MPRKNAGRFAFISDRGDFIGQGTSQQYDQTQPNVTKFIIDSATKNQIRFSIEGSGNWWNLEFAAPKGQRLKVGVYENATRAAFHADNEPGLTMSGCGRGANRTSGSFTINRIQFSRKGELVMLDAQFTHRDVGFRPESEYQSIPAVRGAIYYYKKPEVASLAAAG